MKKEILFITLLLLTKLVFPQNCNCADNYTWVKETFEKNDAGFQYAVDQKGEAEYKKHCDLYAEKVKTITDKDVCEETLIKWLRFFRRGHLWLRSTDNKEAPKKENIDKDKIRKQYKDWEKYAYNEKEFKDYLSKLKEPTLEGIWTSSPYIIGIRKVKEEYIGFVIEADGVYWSKGQVKFKIRNENGKFHATYFMQNHEGKEIKEVQLTGNNYLSMEFVFLKRTSPTFAADKEIDRFLKFQETDVPLFEKLNDKTTVLRIPSFDGSQKKRIDSVVMTNMKTITSTENLIIDLRWNGGGSDGSFEKLIPIIYTNPMRVVGMEFLSTPLNNKRMEDYANDPEASAEDKKWAREATEKLNKNVGKFVSLDSNIVDFETSDTIYAYPKNVGIIINGGCGSTTEQFILAAKQSQKVKLFGTSTFGSLDISNMLSVKSPCNDLELGYCLSKSYRIPDFTIDGKGLQPDYYLDKTIKGYEWIDFVNKILSNK